MRQYRTVTESNGASLSEIGPRTARRSWLIGISGVIIGLIVGALVSWSVVTVFATPKEGLPEESSATTEVVHGQVGSSLSVNTIGSWLNSVTATNRASGVVTTVDIEPGAEVSVGQKLYSVGLRPVVVAEGSIPAFGAMQLGDTGDHIHQLQEFLSVVGVFQGEPDGNFGPSTHTAVEAWQQQLGYPVDGVIQQGDLVWLPHVPVRVLLDSELLTPGNQVENGQGVISALANTPTFQIPLSSSQSQLAVEGTHVTISSPEGDLWEAQVSTLTPDPQNTDSLNANLVPVGDSESICKKNCAAISPDGKTILSSQIVTVPSESGLTVPSAAIRTAPDGRTFVVDPSGTEHNVSVIQTARGISLIEGVDAGLTVLVVGEDTP